MMKYIAMFMLLVLAGCAQAEEKKIGPYKRVEVICVAGHLFVVAHSTSGMAITQVYKNNAEYGPTAAPVPVECKD